MLLLVIISILLSGIYGATSCAYFNQGPIDITLDQQLGSIELKEIIEISFDLNVNEQCTSYCHILALGFRSLSIYTHSNKIIVETDDANDIVSTAAYPVTTDGTYHSLYFRFSSTIGILEIDDVTYFMQNFSFRDAQSMGVTFNINAVLAIPILLRGLQYKSI